MTRVCIGVIGHRRLNDMSAVRSAVTQRIEQILGNLERPFSVLSCLAEGADRVVVDCASRLTGMSLTAVLPLDRTEYLRDFESAASKTEFLNWLERANEVVTFEQVGTRGEAYLTAGRYVVDHCTALIALWDGKLSRGIGGTAEVLGYANSRLAPGAIHVIPVSCADKVIL